MLREGEPLNKEDLGMAKKTSKRKQRYTENKAAKVGTELVCPICGKSFTKRQWAQAFCCTDCKNKYWNDKGDRHKEGYYEDYDLQHPERIRNRILYGTTQAVYVGGVTCAAQRAVAQHRAGVATLLRRYSDKELIENYKRHKNGNTTLLSEDETLFDI